MNEIKRVLNFWFGDQAKSNDPNYWQAKNELWFGFNEKTDQLITTTFKPLLLQALKNELQNWENTPSGRLALIVLSDQFPRNIFRGTADAFSFDHFALQQCRHGLEARQHAELHPVQQVFFFMPLEHSENIAEQNTCVDLFEKLVASCSPAMLNTMGNFRDFAIKHRDIIAKFGRFPHRNALLGRSSTSEELQYLQSGGSTFGQG